MITISRLHVEIYVKQPDTCRHRNLVCESLPGALPAWIEYTAPYLSCNEHTITNRLQIAMPILPGRLLHTAQRRSTGGRSLRRHFLSRMTSSAVHGL